MALESIHIVIRRKGVGDTVAATPLIRDLHNSYPDIRISVDGTLSPMIFDRDTRVSPRHPAAEEVVVDYKPTHDRARLDKSARYLHACHEDFESKTGMKVLRGPLRPDLVLGPDEIHPRNEHPTIVIASGAKWDMPLKLYPHSRWCEIVRLGTLRGWKFRQVGEIHDGRYPHIQKSIPDAENMLGRTTIRQLFSVISSADAVVCHVSLPMLVASAFKVPCVAIGGGRENPWLFADSGIEYMDTIGKLSCCTLGGCHACFALPAHNGTYPPGALCADPVSEDDGPGYGRCMTLISPEEIVERISSLLVT